ncbi:MAG: LacI family DNA-binding transcriptional regulator [Butyrivibrio sp.]|uniref:LacI family DNA-binding transcriptional regulator n=1 Tax=Butyrivibrio sp. TaxID=28121 RepID=UPI001B13938B|nr:LacI family DNA-binding transcriptional regulator [Butyrivibrio sp.]MBO6239308.1 LacI family DNA-binding transcriptional regulator [Butyrivibrio sp.]
MEKEKLNTAKTITIYDIAKEAGVSASTVSRVLTGSASVRKEKKERIQKIIEKYNFKPNALAKGLSDTSTKTIGVIAADIRNPFYASLFVSCELAAEAAGYSVVLANSLGVKEREVNQLDYLMQQRVDAIIQIGGRVDDLVTDDSYAEKLRDICKTTPVVVTGKIDKAPVYSVSINQTKAMDIIMEHLIGLGHEKIAMVGGLMRVVSTYNKYNSYVENLKKHGIAVKGEYVINGNYDPVSGYEGTNKLLELSEQPTAIVAINDFAASGALRSIREHGLRVPEDISVVSFDNTYTADILSPKLTSIDYDYDHFGKMLVDTAIAVIKGQKTDDNQMVEPRLVFRESTGKAPD